MRVLLSVFNIGRIITLLCLLLIVSLVGCIKPNPTYYNNTVNSDSITASYYIPNSFYLLKEDTAGYNESIANRRIYTYSSDTNINIWVLQSNYAFYRRGRKIDFLKMLQEKKEDLLNSDYTNTAANFKFIHGVKFIERRYTFTGAKYMGNQLLTYYHDRLFTIIIHNYNCLQNDTIAYKRIRDSVYNSVVIKPRYSK